MSIANKTNVMTEQLVLLYRYCWDYKLTHYVHCEIMQAAMNSPASENITYVLHTASGMTFEIKRHLLTHIGAENAQWLRRGDRAPYRKSGFSRSGGRDKRIR